MKKTIILASLGLLLVIGVVVGVILTKRSNAPIPDNQTVNQVEVKEDSNNPSKMAGFLTLENPTTTESEFETESDKKFYETFGKYTVEEIKKQTDVVNPRACANWQGRYNYVSQRFAHAARFGTMQEMYYWSNQAEQLNYEIQKYRYCDPIRRNNTSGMCDRGAYNSCMSDARAMTSPTTGGQTTTGILMQAQCQQWISGCR